MGGVAIGLIGFFVFLMARLSTPQMDLLYGDLSLTDSGAMVQRLDEMAVPYQVEGDGGRILVPIDQVDRVRVLLAEEGLPRGGSIGAVGNEIWDQTDGFGTTNFMQNINRLRAMEGELARTISTIAGVQSARVHLVLPERELFSRDRQDPSASVVLQLDRAGLSNEQVMAIRHLVATAVPGLQPTHISIVDDQGTLLASGADGDEGSLQLADDMEIRRDYERRLVEQIEQLLGQSVGVGKIEARVSAQMDFDRVTTSEERYDPDSQVARSVQFIEDTTESTSGGGPDPVTVATNLPEADVPGLFDGGGMAGPSETASRTEETTNFEISRIVQNTVRDAPVVTRLSIAVMIDGIYRPNAEGVLEYQPRDMEEMEKLAALARSAVGFDAARGDTIEVVNMRFASTDTDLAAPLPDNTLFGVPRDDLFRMAEMLVLAIVAVLVILLVIRPLLARVLEGSRNAPVGDALDGFLPDPTGGMQRAALAGPGMSGMPGLSNADLAALPSGGGQEESELDALIDIGQVEGRVRASSLRKVGEIVEKHPEEAVAIIRNWLYQES